MEKKKIQCPLQLMFSKIEIFSIGQYKDFCPLISRVLSQTTVVTRTKLLPDRGHKQNNGYIFVHFVTLL